MKKRYILSPHIALRGWKLLPYAVQNLATGRSEFLREKPWNLIRLCDGQTEIDPEVLSPEDRQWYERWLKGNFIRETDNGERLRSDQEYRYYNVRFKESVQWSITGKCNYRCKHCFMSAPHGAQGEPRWEELMTMLDAFERCGIKIISLTGGEPMIRKDFWNLVDEILSRHMIIDTLYSNGLLITDRFLDELDRRMIRPSIQFSFDGVGYHDWMRGVPGAEKTVIDAFKRCRDRDIITTASMVVCRESKDSIRDSVNLLAELGCKYLKVGNAYPQGEWKEQKEHYLTQDELYEAFLSYIPRYFEDGAPMSIGLEGFFKYNTAVQEAAADFEKDIEKERFSKALMCGHVRRGMYVSPKGNVLSCMSMVGGPIEEKFPNMLYTPLEEILDDSSMYMEMINYRVSDFVAHNPECGECKYLTKCCGGCRAIAVRDNPKDYLAKDMITCSYYKNGWMERKKERLFHGA